MGETAENPPTRAPLDSAEVRLLAPALAAGRLVIGAGLMLAPRPTLAALGFSDPPASTIVTARLAGARDLVLGAVMGAAIADRERLRRATVACAAADACDSAVFATAISSGDGSARRAGLRGLAAAAPATLVGVWLASRLR